MRLAPGRVSVIDLQGVVHWLNEKTGLNVDTIGIGALQGAVKHRMAELGILDSKAYFEVWEARTEERDLLLGRVLVGETWFFREEPAFIVLKEWLEGLHQKWRPGRPLRILVLPCSTGEEAWSVASIVHACGISPESVDIEAMDINADALKVAALGRYPLRKARKRPMPVNLGFLVNDDLEIDPELKRLVRFECANVLDRDAFRTKPAYDVIFLRNLLIYMDEKARSRIFDLVSELLLERGLLFLGHSEVPPANGVWARLPARGAFAWQRRASAEIASDKPFSHVRPPGGT